MKIRTILLSAILATTTSSIFAQQTYPGSPLSHSPVYSDGQIKSMNVVENGTDLVVHFEDGKDWNVHVQSKLDPKVWKPNKRVYMDKRNGHLYMMALQDYF
ncbi:hypothetical protein K6L09_21075 [Burkholderia cepacia]